MRNSNKGLFSENENVTNVESFDSLDENNKAKDIPEMDIVFILDKSGSMHGLENDTIGGFNSFIEREKNKDIKTYVSLILFNDQYDIEYLRKPIEDVEPLTEEVYETGGLTALLDAVGTTITSLGNEISDKAMVVITTDGYENSSMKFTKMQVKELIQSKDWEFLFIGANIDAYHEATALGISDNRTREFEASPTGVRGLYDSVSRFKRAYENDDDYSMDNDWK